MAKGWEQRRRRTFHTVRVAAARVVARGVAAARRPIVWREAPREVTKVMIRESVSVRGGAYYVAYTARRDSRGGEVTAERRDGYESLDHSLAQSHRGALGLEARATSRNLLDRPVAAFSRSRTLCWCSARSAHEGPPLVHSAHSLLSSFGILTILPTHASSLSPSFLSSLASPSPSLSLSLSLLFLDGFRVSKKSQCE